MNFHISVMFMKNEKTFSYYSFQIKTKVYPSYAEIVDMVIQEHPKAYDIAVMGITQMTDKELKYWNKK